jgi:hypothetical protein
MVRLGLAERDAAMLNRAGHAIAAIAPALREQPVASSGTVLAARALAAARQAIGG